MSLLARRAVMFGGKHARLPAEYQEVEWIGNVNTEGPLIDIPLYGSEKITLTIKLSSGEGQTFRGLFGFTDTNSGWLGVQTSHQIVVNGTVTDVLAPINEPKTITYVRDPINGELYMEYNGTRYAYQTFSDELSNNFGLLRIQAKAATSYCGAIRVYYADFGSITLIPCYRKSDGKVGMYDVINDVFYYAETNAQPIKGADV